MTEAVLRLRKLVREERARRNRASALETGAVHPSNVVRLDFDADKRRGASVELCACSVIPFPGRAA